MADILIRGMEMPESCDDCMFERVKAVDHAFCMFAPIPKFETAGCVVDRHPDCPLVELPEHGDLIDRDALMADGWRLYKGAIMHDGSYATYEMPLGNPGVIVVIPANKERGEDA